jgi:hypothetical protein
MRKLSTVRDAPRPLLGDPHAAPRGERPPPRAPIWCARTAGLWRSSDTDDATETGGNSLLAVTNYPLLEVFWTMLIFFAFFIWIWILFMVFADLFRRSDIGGWAKAAWIIFVIVLPYLGVFVYLIAEHKGMTERSIKQQQAMQSEMDSYVKSVASSSDPASQIANAKKLLDEGTITQADFDQIKAKALAT